MAGRCPPAPSVLARMTAPDRLDRIEEKLAHLENAVAQLGDVVLRQQREIDAALHHAQRLERQLEAQNDPSGASATAFEKPPHY